MTYLFLDTEWADDAGHALVSLALVSEDGHHEFYAEVDPLPSNATEFVRNVVYPLLDRGDIAMSHVALAAALWKFLADIPAPVILADFPNDLALLRLTLSGFDDASPVGPLDLPVMTQIMKDDIAQNVLKDWFEGHPEERCRRHHALVDARALRMAWLALTGRIDAGWSPTLAQARGSHAP